MNKSQELSLSRDEAPTIYSGVERVNEGIAEILDKISGKSVVDDKTADSIFDDFLSSTAKCYGFEDTFIEVEHDNTLGITLHNELKMYHLNIQDFQFSTDSMFQFIHKNLGAYVFSRACVDEFYKKGEEQSVVYQALNHLKDTLRNDDDFNDELGDIMLYILLEHILRAPKLFSKIELMNSGKMGSSGGIHLQRINDENDDVFYQMVWGKSEVLDSITEAIDRAFDQIVAEKKGLIKRRNQIDTVLLNQSFLLKEAEILADIILPSDHSKVTPSNAFSLFLGYTLNIPYQGQKVDEYMEQMSQRVTDDINKHAIYIATKIKALGLDMHSFYVYIIPLNNAIAEKKEIAEALLNGRSSL